LPASKISCSRSKATLEKRIGAASKIDDAESLRQLLYLLESPLLKASRRVELMRKQRALAVKLHDAADERDQVDSGSRLPALPDETRKKTRSGRRPDASPDVGVVVAAVRLRGGKTKQFGVPPGDEKNLRQ